MTDDQFIGFSFIASMVAVPFIVPWLKAAYAHWRRPYNTGPRTVQRMIDETNRHRWED